MRQNERNTEEEQKSRQLLPALSRLTHLAHASATLATNVANIWSKSKMAKKGNFHKRLTTRNEDHDLGASSMEVQSSLNDSKAAKVNFRISDIC